MQRATHALDDRGLVAYPAGGRYALGADALDEDAVALLFDATARPADVAASIVVADLEDARHVARVTPVARRLAAHVPGPLVLVLPARPTAPDLLVRADETVAVRVPAEPFARALARHFGPVTAARAARFGEPAARDVAAARAAFGSAVGIYVDGGAVASAPATVVDATGPAVKVIREGAIPAASLSVGV